MPSVLLSNKTFRIITWNRENGYLVLQSSSHPAAARPLGFPHLEIGVHDGDGGQHADAGDDPGDDLDGLDLVAKGDAARDLALELFEAVRDAVVLALDVLPDLVDEHAGNDPEDARQDAEDLVGISAANKTGIKHSSKRTVCIRLKTLLATQCQPM
jgi:hypothetical protein